MNRAAGPFYLSCRRIVGEVEGIIVGGLFSGS